MNLAKALLLWENNPSTPITANNLSESIDFQSQGKFLLFTNDNTDYGTWADQTINQDWNSFSIDQFNLGDKVYNFYDNAAKRVVMDFDNNVKVWEDLPSPYKKILKVKAETKISTSYVDIENNSLQKLNFDFGEQDQIFTIDDLLTQGEQNFEADTKYLIYLFVQYSYNDAAYIKIIKASDENSSFWKETYTNNASPTGQNLISYRKIGGFKTTAISTIDEESVWDLYTYRDELVAEKIKVWENGESRPISAADFKIVDNENIFSLSQSPTVEDALSQTRILLNNLKDKFYTNRRFGVNLQFAPFKPNNTILVDNDADDISIRITPGFIDVLGTQITKTDVVWLADSSVGFYINDGTELIYDAKLAPEDGGEDNILYPGVWTVYINSSGEFTLKHESGPRWMPNYFGWFDEEGRRAIGKFKVRNDDGNYIETFSVTDTFEQNAPTNSIHIHYGTLCPDGLIPCDGKWHDIYNIDTDVYDFNELPPINEWGESWYVETPNYTHATFRGADPAFTMISSGKYNPITNEGGADDNTITGGSESHSHSFPHNHNSGTLNISESGEHDLRHDVGFTSNTSFVEVNTVPDNTGQKVSVYDHTHNITITGGEHSHVEENISGFTGENTESTQAASSWPTYREAMICIKKI